MLTASSTRLAGVTALEGYEVAPYDEAELDRLHAAGIDDPEDDPTVLVEPPSGGTPRLWFQRAPESKVAKNRVHLDLTCVDVGADVERLSSSQPPRQTRPADVAARSAFADI
ncbi:MAG TPA: VOC family protein [Mycobacterium sp.]|nr:VOC family protein [Mycobacterium sp.]